MESVEGSEATRLEGAGAGLDRHLLELCRTSGTDCPAHRALRRIRRTRSGHRQHGLRLRHVRWLRKDRSGGNLEEASQPARGCRHRGRLAVTPDERRAIEWDCARLVALYANLNDAARWEEVAALYTEDGIMSRPTAPDSPIVGRAAILAAFHGRPARKTRHLCSNVVIEILSSTDARGE